tara:strand:+ start:260 stop:406 length:147 start_codon:yes stop_codon:yes gene_type:complete
MSISQTTESQGGRKEDFWGLKEMRLNISNVWCAQNSFQFSWLKKFGYE